MKLSKLATGVIAPGACKICGLEKKDCPMFNGEMNMAMTPKEIRGIKNRRE